LVKLLKIKRERVLFKDCHGEGNNTSNTNSRRYNKNENKLEFPTIVGEGRKINTF
jgi:hypothetical protein